MKGLLPRKRTLLRITRRALRSVAYRGRRVAAGPRGAQRLAQGPFTEGPAAVAKIGGLELQAVVAFHRNRERPQEIEWGRRGERLHRNAGVFPAEAAVFEEFCRIYLEAIGRVDHLAVWDNSGEAEIVNRYAREAHLTDLRAFQDPTCMVRWTARLEGRRVLVLHPFADTIERQYGRRGELWPGLPGLLPAFHLQTIRVPLSAALAPSPFESWADGLARLRDRIDRTEYDIALIGAGAWSLPLAVHAKSTGRVGFHLGGMTQVLFGIKGRRWDGDRSVASHYNRHWVRPAPGETPRNAHLVERGCYW